jgi:hypothetical protein
VIALALSSAPLGSFNVEPPQLFGARDEIAISWFFFQIMHEPKFPINHHIFHFFLENVKDVSGFSAKDVAVDVIKHSGITVVVIDQPDGIKLLTDLAH